MDTSRKNYGNSLNRYYLQKDHLMAEGYQAMSGIFSVPFTGYSGPVPHGDLFPQPLVPGKLFIHASDDGSSVVAGMPFLPCLQDLRIWKLS